MKQVIDEYDYIHDDEVEWYAGQVEMLNEEEGSTISSMCFFHMPLQEYRTAYEGIRLTYGMSIDYLAMPGIENDTKQRGATLITLHDDTSFDIEQIKLTDVQ